MRFNIVVEPDSNSGERGCIYVILLLTFLPFILGLIMGYYIMLISIPVGIILILIFNSANKGKFNHQTWIKKDLLVFTENHLKNELLQTEYQWNKIEQLHILIYSYDSQQKRRLGGADSHFNGLENTIKFKYGKENLTFKFYIRLKDDKKRFITFLRDSLKTEIKEGKVSIFLNRFDGSIDYPINSIDKDCEELVH